MPIPSDISAANDLVLEKIEQIDDRNILGFLPLTLEEEEEVIRSVKTFLRERNGNSTAIHKMLQLYSSCFFCFRTYMVTFSIWVVLMHYY